MSEPQDPLRHDENRQRKTSQDGTASSAGVSNFILGGSDYYADQRLAHLLKRRAPKFSAAVLINHTHNHLTVRMLAQERHFRAFLDLGAGLPTLLRGLPDTAAAAARAADGTRVVQVNRGAKDEAHLRTRSAGRDGQNTSILAGLSHIDAILAHPAVQALQDDGPVAVLAHDVLPYLHDEVADRVIRAVRAWLRPGSVISLTHATHDLHPDAEGVAAAVEVLRDAGLTYRARTRDQIHALLDPWPLLPPGLVPTARYHPARPHAALPAHHSSAYAAIAIHPPTSATGPKGRISR